MPLETMLLIDFWQNCYALSDMIDEETLYDRSEAMRRFAGLELGNSHVLDSITLVNFRQILRRHGLTETIFADVNAHMTNKGTTLRSGMLVDETIIEAPFSTKNKAKARNSAMSSTKNGHDWYLM